MDYGTWTNYICAGATIMYDTGAQVVASIIAGAAAIAWYAKFIP